MSLGAGIVRYTQETHWKLVTHPGPLVTRVDVLPLTPLSVVSLLAPEHEPCFTNPGVGWDLLARLFPNDAVVLTPPPVHTVVWYWALAAVQGASLPPCNSRRRQEGWQVTSVLVVFQ